VDKFGSKVLIDTADVLFLSCVSIILQVRFFSVKKCSSWNAI